MKPRWVMARMSLELSFGSRNANTSAISVDWLLLAMGASPWSAACGATGRQNPSASQHQLLSANPSKNSFLICLPPLPRRDSFSTRSSLFIELLPLPPKDTLLGESTRTNQIWIHRGELYFACIVVAFASATSLSLHFSCFHRKDSAPGKGSPLHPTQLLSRKRKYKGLDE